MTRKLWLLAVVIVPVFIFENICRAESAELLEMSGSRHENVSGVSFFFDRIPEFEIEDSGQRVRVVLAQTRFAPSFKNMLQDELIFQIKTIENVQESVIELYFRNLPKYLDVAVDKQNARLRMNIIWDKERLGGRPAILDQRLGEVKTSSDGSIAHKLVSSRYSGRWIDFFREFEWPVDISLPINFSFPPFPSPLIMDNSEFLPQDLLKEENISFCDQVKKKFSDLLVENTRVQDIGLYGLIVSECLLRQKDHKQALDVLEQAGEKIHHESLNGWKLYYQSYARAIAGKYYQAANLPAGWEERFGNVKGLGPWWLMLQVELELAKENPGQVLVLLSPETELDGHLGRLYKLRKADALYQLGQYDDADAIYLNMFDDLSSFQQHPYSLANRADVLYKKKEYMEAYRNYSYLSGMLKNEFSQQRSMLIYQSAMAVLRSGDQERARLMFMEINKKEDKSEAGLRSGLKLLDLDILNDLKPELSHVLSEYDEIIKFGPVRKLREEAFFKKILACHLYGEDIRAVKLLGRFFDDYWAGDLQPEAQALFIEIFPKVVEELIAQDASFLALTLVAKHRNLLAQARITYDFLYNLAKSYSEAGFLEQTETTYFFMLDFEKNSESKEGVFLPLIQILHQQKKYEQVQKYASYYLKDYPEGTEKPKVLYYYADVLFKTGDVGTAISLLIDKNRPKSEELDILTGDMFFELGKYDLVEYYLSRAVAGEANKKKPEINLKRAEAFFFTQKWQHAIPLYESLLDEPLFRGQSGYRLILIFYEQGQTKKALNLYKHLTETEIEEQWLKLATQTVQTELP
jgi:tetratricopeptide (TPR) repeat protein